MEEDEFWKKDGLLEEAVDQFIVDLEVSDMENEEADEYELTDESGDDDDAEDTLDTEDRQILAAELE